MSFIQRMGNMLITQNPITCWWGIKLFFFTDRRLEKCILKTDISFNNFYYKLIVEKNYILLWRIRPAAAPGAAADMFAVNKKKPLFLYCLRTSPPAILNFSILYDTHISMIKFNITRRNTQLLVLEPNTESWVFFEILNIEHWNVSGLIRYSHCG